MDLSGAQDREAGAYLFELAAGLSYSNLGSSMPFSLGLSIFPSNPSGREPLRRKGKPVKDFVVMSGPFKGTTGLTLPSPPMPRKDRLKVTRGNDGSVRRSGRLPGVQVWLEDADSILYLGGGGDTSQDRMKGLLLRMANRLKRLN